MSAACGSDAGWVGVATPLADAGAVLVLALPLRPLRREPNRRVSSGCDADAGAGDAAGDAAAAASVAPRFCRFSSLSRLILRRSLRPRGSDWIFENFKLKRNSMRGTRSHFLTIEIEQFWSRMFNEVHLTREELEKEPNFLITFNFFSVLSCLFFTIINEHAVFKRDEPNGKCWKFKKIGAHFSICNRSSATPKARQAEERKTR